MSITIRGERRISPNERITEPDILRGKEDYIINAHPENRDGANTTYHAATRDGVQVFIKRYVLRPKKSLARSRAAQGIIEFWGGHPNLMESIDFVEDVTDVLGFPESRCYEVLPYIEGRTVSSLLVEPNKDLGRRQMSLDDLARFVPEILDALSFLHTFGIIHRDVKPANMYLAGNGITCDDLRSDKDITPLLFDFDIVYCEETEFTEEENKIAGTPLYISPEAWCEPIPDRRVDIYAMGISLYEMTTGMRPFNGKPIQIASQALNMGTPDPKKDNKEINDDLRGIIIKALQCDPNHRYQNAVAMKQDFMEIF